MGRMGFTLRKCVSPQVEWTEKVISDSSSCIDATVSTRGKSKVPEADDATRSFCQERCRDVFEREREWSTGEVFDVCDTICESYAMHPFSFRVAGVGSHVVAGKVNRNG